MSICQRPTNSPLSTPITNYTNLSILLTTKANVTSPQASHPRILASMALEHANNAKTIPNPGSSAALSPPSAPLTHRFLAVADRAAQVAVARTNPQPRSPGPLNLQPCRQVPRLAARTRTRRYPATETLRRRATSSARGCQSWQR